MEDFTPEKFYHPEDEYESLFTERDKLEAEKADAAQQTASDSVEPNVTPSAEEKVTAEKPITETAEAADVSPRQEQPKEQTPPAQPPQKSAYPNTAPPYAYYPYYQQPVGYQQTVGYQQPVQYYYPNAAYPYTSPVYPQTTAAPQQTVQAVQPYAQSQSPAQTPDVTRTQWTPTKPPKQPTPLGTKVFIIILCALLLAMILGFAAYIASSQRDKGSQSGKPEYPFYIGGDDDSDSEDDSDYGFDPYSFNINGDSYTDVEDTITLIADNGETQQRDDDNAESVGEPDENAKNITLEALPKDKADAKYTTQSAYAAVSDSVVTVVCYQDTVTGEDEDIVSQGSGVIISEDGYLITNAHVIGNSRIYAVNIVMNSGEEYQAKIIGYDTWTDLAVLKIDATDLKAVTFGDSDQIAIGDDVIAVGSPGGEQFQNTLTKGVVSAVDRELSVNKNVRYIQSDAAISPGSSGGPLCNIYGQVIGITTAKAVAENFESMSFSIPSASVEKVVGDLMHYGYVKGRTRIGFSGTEVSSSDALSGSVPSGVIVGKIDENGSLAGSDIREGDIITELDGKTITSFQDIYEVLDDHKPDDEVTIKAKRPSNSSSFE